MRHGFVHIPAAAITIMLLGAGSNAPVAAQIPDDFTNLQHFPSDISRDELIGHMRQFSFALGVRCQYCHFGGDGISFEGVEFASDEKAGKRRARYMLEMTGTINGTLLSSVPDRRSPNIQVECRTCHRGLPRPEMIDDVMRRRIGSEGVESAVAHYRSLRDEGYGGWSYDFGEWVINDLASEFEDTDPSTAAALMRMNVDYNPESVSAWGALGRFEEAAGDPEAAIAAYRRALELAPGAERFIEALRRLGIEP